MATRVFAVDLGAWSVKLAIASPGIRGAMLLSVVERMLPPPQVEGESTESRAKRANFLRHVAATLALQNVVVAKTRAEDLTRQQPFDTVLARAVARPAKLLEIQQPLVTPQGRAHQALASDDAARSQGPDAESASELERVAGEGHARLLDDSRPG